MDIIQPGLVKPPFCSDPVSAGRVHQVGSKFLIGTKLITIISILRRRRRRRDEPLTCLSLSHYYFPTLLQIFFFFLHVLITFLSLSLYIYMILWIECSLWKFCLLFYRFFDILFMIWRAGHVESEGNSRKDLNQFAILLAVASAIAVHQSQNRKLQRILLLL